MLHYKMLIFKSKKGQVWVETVVYTLIGLSLIGLVLAIMTPQIKQYRDDNLIEQSIASFERFDSKVIEVVGAPGNKRKLEFGLSRGNFFINSTGDLIRFELSDSNSEYSENGENITLGRVNITTLKLSKKYKVILLMKFAQNITYNGEDGDEHEFNPVSIPYNFFIENRGFDDNGVLQIDFKN
jgi:hypothetical protein